MNRITGLGIVVAFGISLGAIAPSADAAVHAAALAQGVSKAHAEKRASHAPPRAMRYPAVGRELRALPRGHRVVRVERADYRYHNGVFYRPARAGAYVVVSAPLGARVGYLPATRISFLIGPQRYFYVNYTYYRWDRPADEYIVVEEPLGAEAAVVAASASDSGEIFVYPKQGQSDEQRDRDRYECYLWAVDQTGFDPGAADPEATNGADYRRATSVCLEGRGYTVK